MAFLISGAGRRTARSYQGAPDRAATLELEYFRVCDADADGDGVLCALDCDDGDASVHPGAEDVCDGLDNDCDGTIDEDFAASACTTGEPGICAAGTSSCESGVELCDADVGPAIEICDDGLDNDCDGATDGTDTVDCAPTKLTIPLATGHDDAEERVSLGGSITRKSRSLQLTQDGSVQQVVGLRFEGVAIPRGSTLLRARIQFTADASSSSPASLTLEGEASDDAPPFSRTNGDLTARPRTSESVSWSPAAWPSNGASGTDQRTRNLKAIVQEIVDRPGWRAGNAIAFLISGSGDRSVEAFETDPARAATLELEFAEPAP
jgi:hypothetical protein